MADNISSEHYRAEISMLNHEIYDLTRKLEEKEREKAEISKIDKHDPFNNPTEYHHYNSDYTEINPLIGFNGYELPLEPASQERKQIKKNYTIGGVTLLLHFLAGNILSTLLIYIVMLILQFKHLEASYDSLYDYAFGSPAFVAITMLTYLLTNVGFAFMGLKWSRTKAASLIQTKDFRFSTAVKYCFCAVFIQYVAAIFSYGISDIVDKYGYSIDVMDDSAMAQTTLGMILMIIYTCIIAPITEELFYRGMLLKVFSRTNQRFGIFISSVFFGLAHGNIRQFMLAFLLGIFLSHITMKHNSLLPSTIVHIFVNSLSTVINELSDRGLDENALLAVELIYLLIAIAGIAFFIEFKGSDKLPATTPHQSRRGFAVAKSSLAVVIILILLTATMIANIFIAAM